MTARALRLLRWLPSAVWMAVIFFASSLPGSSVPGDYSVYAHFIEYGILGVLLFLALRETRDARTAALVAVLAASAYGITDELHQLFTPGRVSDPLDWLTDTAGAALFVIVAFRWARWRASRTLDRSA